MSIPRMNYRQYRKARKLTHECCNYCDGNCLLLDDGEECVCVQSISYSLLCRWFRAAVLPLDAALYAEISKSRDEVKRCAVCGAVFTPKSNRAKYCPDCAVRMRRKKEAERQRKRYLLLWSSIFVTFRSKNSLCMSCFKWRLPIIIRMGTDMIIPYAHISPDCFIQTFRTGKTVRID